MGLWIAAGLLGDKINYDSRIGVVVVSGLILAIVNTVIKPIVVILSLPAILFSLGLFMVVINGLLVYIVGWLYPQMQIATFGTAVLAGLVIGLVNYLVSVILEERS
ncbi:phage holin family protein [Candidatus Saccharibacteria bacterium]|nr:phage holin family protein [Candidatus Saccharibacteria bacterium]